MITTVPQRHSQHSNVVSRGVPYILDDGRFVGPFAVQLHTPEIGQHWLGMVEGMRKLQGLSNINREIAIVVTGSRFDASYELEAHKYLGRKFGLSGEEVNDLLNGKKPGSFMGEQNAVFDVAYALAYTPGPLPQPLWDKSVEQIGLEGTTALVQYVGLYSYICMILKGFDVKVPETN